MPCASLSMVFHIRLRPCWLIFRILLAFGDQDASNRRTRAAIYRGNRYHQGGVVLQPTTRTAAG